MNRKVAGLVGAVILVIAVLLWMRRDRADSSTGAGPTAAAKVTTGGAKVATTRRADPRTQPRGSIAGVVRSEDKAPIAGATVCADITAYDLPAELTRDPICTTTDATGAYALGNLLAAKYSVDAGARTYRPATFHPDGDRRKTSFELAAGQAKTGIDFALRGGAVEVTGTVSDISGGPVAHAHVRAIPGQWGDGDGGPVVESDDKGAFSVWTAPGSQRVTATADGYAPATESARAPGNVALLLTPESSLSGLVVDASTGKPLEGARVTVESSQWGWGDGEQAERTDAEGKFRVQRLTPGRFVTTAVTEQGYGRTEGSTLVGLGQHVDGVIVKVFPASRITGKVMIAGDKPTVCAEGYVSFRDEDKDREARGRREPDGTIIAEGVLPGTYKPRVWCDGYQPKDTYPAIVIIGKDVLDQVWEVDAGATIRGRVLTRGGAPIEDAQVMAQTTGGDARAKSDWSGDRSQRDGTFELRAMRPATYKLTVDSDTAIGPREGFKVEVPAGKTVEKDLILDDGGSIKGTVVDAEGKPVADVSINAAPFAGDTMWWGGGDHKSDATGAFQLDALRPGDYRVSAQRSWSDRLRKPGTTDNAKQGERTTVRAGQTATVKLVVESQNGKISGIVVDPDGKPVSDAFLSSARESDAAGAQTTSAQQTRGWGWGDSDTPVLTATDGTFTIGKLGPGKYTLRAYRKGGGEAIAEHVAVGSTARLEIKKTGSIEGTATREGGPLDEITVRLEDLKTGFLRSETYFKTQGQFTLHDLPAGHFQLTVSAEGGRKKIELDLADAEAKTGVTVALEPLVTLTGRIVDLQTKQPVPGMRMSAQLAQGGSMRFSWGDDERDNISDSSGKFTIKRAPRGQLAVMGMSRDFQESDYSWIRVLRTVDGTGTIDLGDITVLKKRLKQGEVGGAIGMHFVEMAQDTAPDKMRLEVAFIEPAGPAAKIGIKVGDIITTIDGIDVTGGNSVQAWTLLRAPVGTKLTLGLARGETVVLTLAAPT